MACDFFVVVTSAFRLLCVLVAIEQRSRRLVRYNVTSHPSASWTAQRLRDAVGYQNLYKYLIHARDSIFAHDGSTAR